MRLLCDDLCLVKQAELVGLAEELNAKFHIGTKSHNGNHGRELGISPADWAKAVKRANSYMDTVYGDEQ